MCLIILLFFSFPRGHAHAKKATKQSKQCDVMSSWGLQKKDHCT